MTGDLPTGGSRSSGPAAPRPPDGRVHLVCGMHRSGTSMVAAVLQACGVHLGGDGELVDAAADNPRGFGEHRVAVDVDDRLLAAMDAAWDLPPSAVGDDWWTQDRLGGLRHRARALLGDLVSASATGHVGIKDPRLSLTLPFWRAQLGDHRVVVCVRNPLEVAASLADRNGTSARHALHLWEAYHRAVDAELPTTHRLVVHYAAVLADPVGQIRRIAAALGLDVDEAAALRAVDRGDRHHRFGEAELRHVGVPTTVTDRYLALCDEAGWHEPATATGVAAPAPAPTSVGIDLDALARVRLTSELAVRGGHVALLEARIAELEDRPVGPEAHPPQPGDAPGRRVGRAMVVQHRLPEYDRERGSARVLEVVDALVDAGWAVDFWALDVDEAAMADDDHQRRYVERLTRRGVRVHPGDTDSATDLIDTGELDLCIAAFWHVGARVLPLVRSRSPRTRVVVDSVDLHLLRESRRLLDVPGPGGMGSLGPEDGARMAAELNVYAGADVVLTVSVREAQLVDEFVGRPGLGHAVALGDPAVPSPSTEPGERKGVAFVGNFRHLPNIEAVEHLCSAVLPRLDPELLERHPVRVIGNALDDRVVAVGTFPHVELVGWVDDVEPHLHATRVSVVPLQHGAGVKGKVIQSLLAGTPVVSTPVGVEGLDLPADGVAPVVVASDPAEMAAAVERLLTDDDLWIAHRDAGLAWARHHHGRATVAEALLAAVDLDRPVRAPVTNGGGASSRRWLHSYEQVRAAVADAGASLPEDALALVASGGDDQLVACQTRPAVHFPADDAGAHLGWNPDGAELVARLDAACRRGGTHLVVPATQYWWWHLHPELRDRLAGLPVVHRSADCRVFDLGTEPVLVHVDAAVQDPEVAAAHLRELLARSEHQVVAMPTDVVAGSVGPPLVRQLGITTRTMVGLGAGPAIAARGDAAVAALQAALDGDARALHDLTVEVDDAHPVHLLADASTPSAPSRRARILSVMDRDGRRHDHLDDGPGLGEPLVSVVVATRDRAALLDGCLASIQAQVRSRGDVEVVVVDDGSVDDTAAVIDRRALSVPMRRAWLPGCGRSAAKNLGVMVARGHLVLLLDDDDRLLDGALDAYIGAHTELPADERPRTAVLGHTDWAPELDVTAVMHHVTDVGCQLFSYPNLRAAQRLDWRHFWEGRLLVDRGLLVVEGLHEQRLDYSVDVELARRLDRGAPIAIVYEPRARGVMARPVDLVALLVRAHAKGIAQRTIVELHPDDPELSAYCAADPADPADLREEVAAALTALGPAADPSATVGGPLPSHLATMVDRAVAAATALGVHGEALPPMTASAPLEPSAPSVIDVAPEPNSSPPTPAVRDDRPQVSVIMPVWSLTEELAAMATRTLARIREVSLLRTELIVIDNGSPVATDLHTADRVIALSENRGVGPAWNLGASVALSPLLCFVNSDCEVTPGWDRALAHAATDGRRIAFPYTDHADGLGPTAPDQAGTAGWCFMLHRDLFAEVGGFDESFAPAYFEDTDYWHRAWDMGVDLCPVPAAVVRHQRRTTGRHAPGFDEVFERNRRRYEAKHGLGLDAPPPYYAREIVEYPPPGRHRLARLRPWASAGADRPRVFGVGLNKTGTSSLHAAVSHLGFTSVHHGGDELSDAMAAARRDGRPMLSDVPGDLDAFFDIEDVRCNYAELDRTHPGSKFILSVRDVDAWVDSRIRHVEHNQALRSRGEPHGRFLDVDVDAWLAEREAHHDAVLAHFAGRPEDLLVIDVCAGQGWERLAPFLGWGRLPERRFPWENRAGGPDHRLAGSAERH